MNSQKSFIVIFLAVILLISLPDKFLTAQRVTTGLQALYDFKEGSGTTVNDVSGIGTPLNLDIANSGAVSWIGGGGLSINSSTIIKSPGAANKIINACKSSNELTVEAWIAPANTTQKGPARIVTCSGDPTHRYFQLAQGLWGSQPGDLYDGRIRTTTTSDNGEPSLSTASGVLTTALSHVVYTRSFSGAVNIYVDGVQVANDTRDGNLSNWTDGYQLLLANELTEDRPWLGEYYLVAVYNYALNSTDVNQNFLAGPGLEPTPPSIIQQPLDQTAYEGFSATFTIVATGNPAPNYQWYRNNQLISGATEASYTTPVTNLAENGDDLYCIVSNSEGSMTSDVAYLTVLEYTVGNRVMCLGNSITYDNHGSDSRPSSKRLSFRYSLWQLLTTNGFGFQFVGSQYAGEEYFPIQSDAHNEGWPGWTDSQIRDNIIGWLNQNPADIILLHIGTNGLNPDPTQVEEILDNIDTWENSANGNPVWVVLAKIINRISYSSQTTQFNTNIANMAQNRINNQGDQIVIVDMENGANIKYDQYPAGNMWDNLHPDDDGYGKMAYVYYEALKNLLPNAPTICPSGMTHYWKMEKVVPPYMDFYGRTVAGGHYNFVSNVTDHYDPYAPISTNGMVGNAAQFSRTGPDQVSVEDDDSYDWGPGDSFTIEYWMKKESGLTGTATNNNEVIISRDDANSSLHWWLGVAATNGGVACFQLIDNNGDGGAVYGTTNLVQSGWHHIVCTRDGNTGLNSVYVDGVLENSATVAGSYFDSDVPINIGWINLTPFYHYDGIVDEIALYDKVLGESEITAHYASGQAGLGYCQGGEVAPQITSTAPTDGKVDRLYTYDVQAYGNPAPTFGLLVSPAGMTINSNTGLIQWTPTAVDNYDVTVEASNSEGSDTQSFTIHVVEAPTCPDGMSAYWKLDDGTGTTAMDTYDIHHGSLHNGPTWTSGLVGGALDFDGSYAAGEGDYVTVPDNDVFDWAADASFTIELWAKFTNVDTRNKVMIGRDQGGGYPHWWLGANMTTGYANFNCLDVNKNGVAITGNSPINDGNWHHLAVVRDESIETNILYVDGVEVHRAVHNYTAGFQASTPIGIGFMAYNYNDDYFYDGALDEIAIYDQALTETDILNHYNNGMSGQGYCDLSPAPPLIVSTPVTEGRTGQNYYYDVNAVGFPAPAYSLLVNPPGMTIDPGTGEIDWLPTGAGDVSVTVQASNSQGNDQQSFVITVVEAPDCPIDMVSYWKLDETAGPTYYDYFNGHDGTSSNTPASVAGIVNIAQEFNGSSNQINILASTDFDWLSNGSFAIEYWIKTPASSTASGNEVVVGRDDAGSSLHWWTGLWDGGQASFVLIATNGNGSGSANYLYGISDLTDGNWHHIVAMRDYGQGKNLLYVDGNLEDEVSVGYGAGFGSAGAAINIGWLNLSGGYYFQGTIDEVAIYGQPLTSSEIVDHYNSGAGKSYCGAEPPLITSSPVTDGYVGQIYTYDVDATGIPAPTFTLTTNPSGMNIDAVTGMISWTPTTAATFDVTVEATNASGTDVQSFLINVADAPSCPTNLISYLKLDETGTPTSFVDAYGTHNGVCSPNGCPIPTTGIVNGAMQIAGGTSGVGIDIPAHPDFDWAADASFSVAYWMKRPGSLDENDVIVGRDEEGAGASSLHWWVGVNKSGKAICYLIATSGDGQSVIGGTSVNDGNWHYVVFVRDNSGGQNLIYVDGQQDGVATKNSYNAGFGSATADINIGWLNLDVKYTYDGIVDEVAIYNDALDPDVIAQQYLNGMAQHGLCDAFEPVIVSTPITDAVQGAPYTYDVDAAGYPVPTYTLVNPPASMGIDATTGLVSWTPTTAGTFDVTVEATNLVGTDPQSFQIVVIEPPPCPVAMTHFWKLDETSGPPYVDAFGSANASCTNCPSSTSGIVANALWFDGGNDEVNVPDDDTFDWPADGNFTIEYWMNTDKSTSGNRVLVGRDDRTGGAALHWWIGCDGNGKVRFNLNDINGNGVYIGSGNGPALNDGIWHHVAAVRNNGSDQNFIYVDGVLIDQGSHNYTASFASGVPMNIGFLNLSGHYRYEGALDEIAVYDRALPQSEIQQHVTDGQNGLGYCTEPPTFLSIPVTQGRVDQQYIYDADARGNPIPTFSLVTPPAGMTIDANTGMIAWTPAAVGDYPVTVEATNSEGSTTQNFTISVIVGPVCPANMVSYWKLDETSGTTYLDFYNGNDGGTSNPPTPVAGLVGGAQQFDGPANTNEINIPADPSFDWAAGDNFTFEFWIYRPGSIPENDVIIGRDDPSTSLHWWVGLNMSGHAIFVLIDKNQTAEGVVEGTTDLTQGTNWHHIAAVRDASSSQMRLYVDNVLEKTTTSISFTSDFSSSTAAINIGWLSLDKKYTYDGIVDEVAVYDAALEESIIAQHYNDGLAGYGYCPTPPVITSTPITAGNYQSLYAYDVEADGMPAPTFALTTFPTGMTIDPSSGLIEWTPDQGGTYDVTVQASNSAGSADQSFQIVVSNFPENMTSYWRFDETAGSPYKDIAGNHDAQSSSPTPVPGILGGALWFDGVDDEVNVPDVDQYEWTKDQSFTIEYWMNTSASTSGNRVIVGRDDGSTKLHWWVGCNGDGYGFFGLRGNDNVFQGLTGTTILNNGGWHHIVAVRDESTNQNKFYVDGALEISLTHDYAGNFFGNADLNIGYLNLGGHYRYEGTLDELAIYDTALSESEILAHYNAGTGALYCSPFTPVITSFAVVDAMVGMPYSYDVETIGCPTPTYGLTEYPASMTIDPTTGFIAWTPATAGEFDVTVEASNASGIAEQTFKVLAVEPPPCPANTVSYWKLDDGFGTTAMDFYNGNDGTLQGNPTWSTGLVNGALDFDGNDYVTVGDDPSLDWAADANFTIALWAKFTTVSGKNKVMIGRDESNKLHWWLGAQSGTGVASCNLLDSGRNGIGLNGLTPINDNQWHYIVLVRDESADENRLYVDGVEEAFGIHDYTSDFSASTQLDIGYMAYGGNPDYFYTGLLDEIAIYETAFTQEEISQQYLNGMANHGYCELFEPVILTTPVTNAIVGAPYSYDVDAAGNPTPTYTLVTPPAGMTINANNGVIDWLPSAEGNYTIEITATNSEGSVSQSYTLSVVIGPICPVDMISYWKMDDASVPPVVDSYGTNDGGSPSGNEPAPATGIINGALNFDGGDLVDVPDDNSLDWQNGDSFTIEVWIKTTQDFTGNKVFIGKHKNSGEGNFWLGGGDATNDNVLKFNLGSSINNIEITGTTVVNDGNWHHVVAVRNFTTGTNAIYLDGVLENEESASYTGDFESTRVLNIGYYINGYNFNGLLDEIALYNKPLTPAEIQQHYNDGLAGNGYCQLPPQITSTPVISAIQDQLYAYDVEATGMPAPIYALTTKPDGMTIDPASGLIEWTPDATGIYDVTVEASNSVGTDDQSFTISVESGRVSDGLIVLYNFAEGSGDKVNDVSGAGTPLNLTITNTGAVSWLPGGGLSVNSATLITSVDPAAKVFNAVQSSNELTIETWCKPANTAQKGPARIITYSADGYNRNFTMGQGLWGSKPGDLCDVRLRSTTTDNNGTPSLSTDAGTMTTEQLHIVYTRDIAGNAHIYINGVLEKSGTVGGNLSNWNNSYQLGLADEISGDRPWLGEFHLVALFNRALSAAEVQQNYAAGSGVVIPPEAPVIVTHPADLTVIEGATATFSVTATGTAPLDYQWQENGTDISGATGSSYTTPPTTIADYNGNTYQCIVGNSEGSVTSNEATLTVQEPGTRVTEGIQVLYTFNEGAGPVVTDVSGVGSPLDLTIDNVSKVAWLAGGGLAINSGTILSSLQAAQKVIDAVKASNEITVEAWVKPANTTQKGPARIVTLSGDPTHRYFQLGQGLWGTKPSDLYDARIRTTTTTNNGEPSIYTPAGILTTDLTHVVFTRTSAGAVKIYVNAQEEVSGIRGGDLSNWTDGYPLLLANETTLDRDWLGEYHLVAIFDRALSAVEIMQNYLANTTFLPKATAVSSSVSVKSINAEIEENKVLVSWITKHEYNNKGFEVLRSNQEDGDYTVMASFKDDEDLKGYVDSYKEREYAFVDNLTVLGQTYWYKLAYVDIHGKSTEIGPVSVALPLTDNRIQSVSSDIPTEFKIHQNYPNPFNPETNIRFDIPQTKNGSITASLYIFNSLGQMVRELYEGEISFGRFEARWNGKNDQGTNMPSGIYFVIFRSELYTKSIKMVLIR